MGTARLRRPGISIFCGAHKPARLVLTPAHCLRRKKPLNVLTYGLARFMYDTVHHEGINLPGRPEDDKVSPRYLQGGGGADSRNIRNGPEENKRMFEYRSEAARTSQSKWWTQEREDVACGAERMQHLTPIRTEGNTRIVPHGIVEVTPCLPSTTKNDYQLQRARPRYETRNH